MTRRGFALSACALAMLICPLGSHADLSCNPGSRGAGEQQCLANCPETAPQCNPQFTYKNKPIIKILNGLIGVLSIGITAALDVDLGEVTGTDKVIDQTVCGCGPAGVTPPPLQASNALNFSTFLAVIAALDPSKTYYATLTYVDVGVCENDEFVTHWVIIQFGLDKYLTTVEELSDFIADTAVGGISLEK